MKKVNKKKPPLLPENDDKKIYAERIAELKRMNADLTVMLEEYRKKERKIVDALSYADALQKSVEKELKIKYSLECERLCAFRKKWIAAAKNGSAEKDYQKTLSALDECRKILLEEFEDEKIDDFLEETERLDKLDAAVSHEKNTEKRHIDELSEEELQELLRQL
ncbi:MAG: hypothetical protein SO386_03475 [Eubacteriales bacterium]|nr:hypothetical protein [Eubacteriales bacterium]